MHNFFEFKYFVIYVRNYIFPFLKKYIFLILYFILSFYILIIVSHFCGFNMLWLHLQNTVLCEKFCRKILFLQECNEFLYNFRLLYFFYLEAWLMGSYLVPYHIILCYRQHCNYWLNKSMVDIKEMSSDLWDNWYYISHLCIL